MNRKHGVEIAICTHNGERFIEEQLESLAGQTRTPDRLVVVDDGSSDSTVRRVEKFARSSPFQVDIVVNSETLYLVRNFEKAVSLCGDGIVFLADQDDVWHPEKVERMCAEFDKSDMVGLVLCDAEVCDESAKPLGYTLWQSLQFGRAEREMAARGRAFEVFLRRNVTFGCTLAFRGSLKSAILPFPHEHFVHDTWIALVAAALGRVGLVAQPLMKYRRHTGAVSTGGARTLGEKKRIATSQWRAFQKSEAARYPVLRERLLALKPESDKWEDALGEKIKHVTARSSLSPCRAFRIAPVARELITGRYFRFSKGILSAGLDLTAT